MSINADTSSAADAGVNLQTRSVPAQRHPADAEAPQSSSMSDKRIDPDSPRQSLTAAQLEGRACIQCGSEERHLAPAGTLLDVKVVECYTHQQERRLAASPAEWLTVSPCPAWCRDEHSGSDHPDDREHNSLYLNTALQTMPYINYGHGDKPEYKPTGIMTDLVQHYREAEPRICFGDTGDHASYYMTLDEAQEIALHLLVLVSAGRDRSAVPEPQSVISERTGCRPWCTRHWPEDVCDSGAIEGAWLTHDGDDAQIWFHEYGDNGTALPDAERLACAIVRLAVLARGRTMSV
ncbi:DUF6907 domain-containing protein [Nonomuraea rubra]|uniref:Uncharacterized protein n=1 Tax=Nonomuraea rubra TaxID=46180 RepID=A0A7X0NPH1_9ACTN|nr:hypothetical protein [Nonomuraea rubra]MBB6547026.1 hypothetical protein [Nonomuraea rubra]